MIYFLNDMTFVMCLCTYKCIYIPTYPYYLHHDYTERHLTKIGGTIPLFFSVCIVYCCYSFSHPFSSCQCLFTFCIDLNSKLPPFDQILNKVVPENTKCVYRCCSGVYVYSLYIFIITRWKRVRKRVKHRWGCLSRCYTLYIYLFLPGKWRPTK
jgi:hypothetical protein